MTGRTEDVVSVTREGAVLVITINRPEVRNAVNLRVATQLRAALDELDGDPSLRAGVLTGAGGTFCSGMDLRSFGDGERPNVAGYGFAGFVERPPATPLVAAVEGYALAGGFELVLACDLVVASRTATFGLPEVKRGLLAAGGGLLRLPARVPYNLAMEVILTGRQLGAQEAAEVRLVNVLTDPGDALSAALALAAEVAANAPMAVRSSKQAVVESPSWPASEMFQRQSLLADSVRTSADAREGARAFVEKREPVWTDS